MIQCGFLTSTLRPSIRRALRHKPCFTTPRTSPCIRRYSAARGSYARRAPSRYRVFERWARPPPGDITAWVALLDYGLPSHLKKNSDVSNSTEKLEPNDVAEIILAAQRQTSPPNGLDLLFHLGWEEGRWAAVVWLVKHVVEAFAPPLLQSNRLNQTLYTFRGSQSLREMTGSPITLTSASVPQRTLQDTFLSKETLNKLTDKSKPEGHDEQGLLQRNALGQIWRSLGQMTIACADGEIKPEVLELIAFLHHMEIMPMTIYNFKPSDDATHIQQPPMLNLFSSRILTSLSDAAWRAHAKLVVEEARARGDTDAGVRPEIPGTAYRVNIAGLRTEVWLELILWASLHGGWIFEGIEILRTLQREPEPRKWAAYSWRSLLSDGEGVEQDWTKLERQFNMRLAKVEVNASNGISVRRTISSEVVNAYIDALPSVMRVGVGERGISPAQVLSYLTGLRAFLQRSGLTLSAGSWDAIVLRYLDAQEDIVDRIDPTEELVRLAPVIGEELNVGARRNLPPYVLDANALAIGIFHRALRSAIRAGDVEGSIRLLRSLQSRVDRDRHHSLVDFLQSQHKQPAQTEISKTGLFTDNFTGIDYPGFDTQIPPATLGSLLDLIMDARAYDIGKWLLYNEDIDGPMITAKAYQNPNLMPALIRFATETRDQTLLGKIFTSRTGPSNGSPSALSDYTLQNFLNGQVNLKRWDAAVRLLEYIKEKPGANWNIFNLAYVARAMMQEARSVSSGSATDQKESNRARDLFTHMVQGKYDDISRRGVLRHKITVLLGVIAASDSAWARFCLELQPLKGHYSFSLVSNKTFDLLLQGIVAACGSDRGRQMLDTLWPYQVRQAQSVGKRHSGEDAGESRLPTIRPTTLDSADRQNVILRFPGHPDDQITVFRSLQPNMLTIRIILESALAEFDLQVEAARSTQVSLPLKSEDEAENEDFAALNTISWSIRRLRYLRMTQNTLQTLISKNLSSRSMVILKAQRPDLLEQDSTEAYDENT